MDILNAEGFIKHSRQKCELRINIIEDAAAISQKCLNKSKESWVEDHKSDIWKL